MKLALATLVLWSSAFAQTGTPALYAESFRHDPARVTEEKFEMKLSRENLTYREVIKDSRGNDRFTFTVSPDPLEGDTKFIAWQARLVDAQHPTHPNILMSTADMPEDTSSVLWRFCPSKSVDVPAHARRIIKVDGFYVVMQVAAHHFTPPDSPYLDSMTVEVSFANADPRKAAP